MTKEQKIAGFDPNSIGQVTGGMYGLPFTADECEIILLPVPWEVTVSYGSGTAEGPAAILEASYQVDLHDPFVPNAWHRGIAMADIDDEIKSRSDNARRVAARHIEALANGEDPASEERQRDISLIADECRWLNGQVKKRSLDLLKKNSYVGLVGGDHSTPLGFMQALAEHRGEFGILQIDAHADLRNAYEGFEFSHASIMFNALKIAQVKKLVQVGIRDYCEEEVEMIRNSAGRIATFFDRDIKYAQYNGDSWDRICNRIVRELPQQVYVSFDIDGLDPKLCPNTGTPVAGGFETEQVLYLLEKVAGSGRKIIGFDLNEVSAGEGGGDWDANVAARLLYRISNLACSTVAK